MTETPVPPGAPLLEIDGVTRRYRTRNRSGTVEIEACRDVSLTIGSRQFTALVGESGSGKSTLCRLALALERPDGGQVRFAGQDLGQLRPRALRGLRRGFQAVFQDPLASLNPRWRVADSVAHPLRVHGLGEWPSVAEAVPRLLAEVGLAPALAGRLPHELSGGQRQRVCIARALATRPRLVVADEAISSLDVTTQLEILALLIELKQTAGVSLLFVTHDLRTVRRVADQVAVMHQGRIVETGPAERVFTAPRAGYTRQLVSSLLVPRFQPDDRT